MGDARARCAAAFRVCAEEPKSILDAANFDGEDLLVVAPASVDVDCYYACVADISLSLMLYDSELHERMWTSSAWYRPPSGPAEVEKAAKLWDTAGRELRRSGLID